MHFTKLIIATLIFAATQMKAASADDTFNQYILAAVSQLSQHNSGGGYDIKKAYTHDIIYDGKTIRASAPPKTMCVAAVAEVIATAINIYDSEHHDPKVFEQLPAAGFNSMRPTDLRSHIWVDPRLDSYGTADALVTFGVGKRVKFEDLTPGAFVNLNRLNKTGHAVVFIAFLDANGKELATTPKPDLDDIAGFKYFSAQNRNTHGLGYGYAFFSNKDGQSFCPSLPSGIQPDCKVMYSTGQKLLNTGYMLNPSLWDAKLKKRNMEALVEGFYAQTRSRGPSFLGLSPDLTLEEFQTQLDAKDTMELNPIYNNDQD